MKERDRVKVKGWIMDGWMALPEFPGRGQGGGEGGKEGVEVLFGLNGGRD